MHHPRIGLIAVLLLFVTSGFSQLQYDTTALRLLLSDSLKYHRTYCRTSIVWDSFAHNSGNLIKIDSALYFIPDQYGVVFKIRERGDSITVTRIDKTKFSGF